jgi:hypothetical protein
MNEGSHTSGLGRSRYFWFRFRLRIAAEKKKHQHPPDYRGKTIPPVAQNALPANGSSGRSNIPEKQTEYMLKK